MEKHQLVPGLLYEVPRVVHRFVLWQKDHGAPETLKERDQAMTSYHLHLVSDATGETINSVARACLVQFRGVEPIEHLWSLIRTRRQMEKVLSSIEGNPGPALYTIVKPGPAQPAYGRLPTALNSLHPGVGPSHAHPSQLLWRGS